MPDFTDHKKQLTKAEQLERELHLKQLQINRLLTITQAINNNIKASALFSMFSSFLGWEMGVQRMALYYRKDDKWTCASSLGIPEDLLSIDISGILPSYTRTINISGVDHPLLSKFDVVIPVLHKDTPIAYAFIGSFSDDTDLYNKVQFITTITNIVAVAIENKRLFKRQLEQERLKREMELASEMQRQLIPKSLPKSKFFELASIYQPHLGVGGDYYDCIHFDDGKLAFCIGDISGKGIAAALLMANFQAIFHTLIRKRTSLEAFIRDINDSLIRITKGEKFITFFIAELDLVEGVLYYVNAGHNPPLFIAGNQVQRLDQGCTILGMFEELPEVSTGMIRVPEESLLLAYTDGLTDLQNEQGDYLSDDQLQSFLVRHYKQPVKNFNQLLLKYIEDFKDSEAYPDDFTVLTCKIFPETDA